jgi:hypothetical protein
MSLSKLELEKVWTVEVLLRNKEKKFWNMMEPMPVSRFMAHFGIPNPEWKNFVTRCLCFGTPTSLHSVYDEGDAPPGSSSHHHCRCKKTGPGMMHISGITK